jgi:hypothetical protein
VNSNRVYSGSLSTTSGGYTHTVIERVKHPDQGYVNETLEESIHNIALYKVKFVIVTINSKILI